MNKYRTIRSLKMAKSFIALGLLFGLVGCSQTPNKINVVEKNTIQMESAPALATELTSEDEYEFALDIARLEYSKKNFDKAETLLHKLRKFNRQDTRVYRLLAKVYEASNRQELALTAWQEVNRMSDKLTSDEAELARLALMQDQYDLAKPIYKAWLDSAELSTQISALNNLGFVALLEGDYKQAQDYLQTALKKDPLNSKALNNLKLVNKLKVQP